MKISVVMATYNGEKFLTEQLDSLRDQTRKADEVIIQDDCSNDGTQDLIKSYISNNGLSNTWTFIENEKNLGYAENFKSCTLRASGDVICFCDQDDIWHLDKLQITEKMFKEHKDMSALVANFSPFFDGDKLENKTDTSKNKIDGSLVKLIFNQKNMFLQAPGCTMAFRRELLNKNINSWYKGFAHDEFIWKMAILTGYIYFHHSCVIERRYHANNTSMKKMRDLKQRVIYLENLLKSYQAMNGLTCDKYKKRIISRNINAVKLRINMLNNKKYFNVFLLLFYIDTFQTIKSLPMEFYMSIMRGKFR